MSDPPHPSPRLAVVGGGVSGLAAAHRWMQLAPAAEVRLYEATARLGGPLASESWDGLVLEHGADSFLTRDPCAVDLCRELGLDHELVSTSTENRRALVVCRGKLERVPEGFVLMQANDLGGVLRSPVLSAAGKLRLLAEPLMRTPPKAREPDYDESVASFARRRLGREAYERLVEPLLGGIYVADADNLSLAATMPEFLAAEREFGSLRAAVRAKRNLEVAEVADFAEPSGATSPLPSPPRRGEGAGREDTSAASGARYGAFVTLARGMKSLVDALAAQLPAGSVRLETPAVGLDRTDEDRRWTVRSSAGDRETFDAVILAAPAFRVAPLVAPLDARLAWLLEKISAASSVVVTLVYEREQIARPLDGFGFVVPAIEGREILAASFPGVKFPIRGDARHIPVRVFLGGARRPDMIDREDNELLATAMRELSELVGARAAPRHWSVKRWPRSMPQYAVGHLELVREIEQIARFHRGLALVGASYRGVGIPQCIRSGREAAERLATQLAPR